jgi:SagB-type dehydrogenase family enzyme
VPGWFSRNLPESGGYACAEEVLAVLADTTVLIAGTPAEVVDALARDLTGGGVGEVLTVGPDEPPAKGCAGRRVIAVVVGADTPPGLMDAYIPVLHVAMTAEHVEIGPVLFPGFGACPECLRRSRAEAGSSLTNSHGNENGIVDLAAGLAASEAIALAARLPSGADPRTLTRFSIVDWSTETFWVVPYDDCDTCAVPSAPDLFEWSVQDRPIPLAPGREIPPWEMRRIQELKKQRPLLPTLPRRDLPSANEEVWATLLRQTAGIHEAPPGTPVRRWAPCGGGLASVELYLVDEHGFPGLPGTAFRYDDLGHRLVAVRDDQIRVADLLADTGLDPDADRAEAAIVLVAAHARLAAKYRQFAYRLAHLDAGCASTQLTMVARAHGLEVRFATHWDGRIAEALGLARDDPFITAVATVSRRPVLTPKETACR